MNSKKILHFGGGSLLVAIGTAYGERIPGVVSFAPPARRCSNRQQARTPCF